MSRPPSQASAPSPLREDALDWFVRRRGESFAPADEQAFQAWLAADAAHAEAFAAWQGQWQSFDAIPADSRRRLEANLAYDQAMEAASAHGASNLRHGTPDPARPARRMLVPALCAMLLLAAVSGGAGLLAWQQTQPLFTQAFSTGRGEQTNLMLPDGTRIGLDTATRLEVTFYRGRREARLLDGQALFAVQSDATRPFDVLAGATRVSVVGTRFSVRHTAGMRGDDGVHVAVEEGLVRVAPLAPAAAGATPVQLLPGQQIYSDASGHLDAVAAVAGAGIAPWRDGRVSFVNQRLDRALAELARYRDPKLVIHDESVAALRVTGVFDPLDPETFRRVLPQSLPVRVKDAHGVMEVVRAD